MEELLQRLVALYSIRRIRFSSEEGKEARAIVAQQAGLYQTLTRIFHSVPFGNPHQPGIVEIEGFFSAIFNAAFVHARDTPATIQQNGGELIIDSKIPLLDDDVIQSLKQFVDSLQDQNRTGSEAGRFGVFAASALVAESDVPDLNQIIETSSGGAHRGKCYIAISTYLAAKRAAMSAQRVELDIRSELASAHGSLDNYRSTFESDRAEHRQQLDRLLASENEISHAFENLKEDVRNELLNSATSVQENKQSFTDAMTETHERLKNFEKNIREEQKLESIRLNWGSRFNESRWAFRIACGLLLIYLGATIGSAYCFGLPIVKALATIEQTAAAVAPAPAPQPNIATPPAAAPASQAVAVPKEESVAVAIIHQFGRLIVFSVPVFVWLWAGRALMRYFMRSMLLMDDARQRQTMLDTYFLLSEKGRADERDRPLVLWALFRQTPGHGPDGIEPPDFTEVINAGLKRAGSATG